MLLRRAWIEPGKHYDHAEVVDLAATLTALLGIQAPSGCEGRVLTERLSGR